MNAWDRSNLDFLTTVSFDGFLDWVEQASDEDFEYALELLTQKLTELKMQLEESLDDQDLDVTQAAELLKHIAKFRN